MGPRGRDDARPAKGATVLHHVSFAVTDLARAAVFYDAALRALGYARVWTDATAIGYGESSGGGDRFAIKLITQGCVVPGPGFHLAFCAPDRDSVDAFHRAALRAGGTDNGPPGLRLHYGPDYYAAFVFDPDGYRIEAVANDRVQA
jgi:catechol 2,3-dioxygenase-like lactoylglutathione lyase family enzyme